MAKDPTKRRYKALFDGDEINGKRYALGAPITGLDAPTAAYLVQNGRITEISEDRFQQLTAANKPKAAAKKPAAQKAAAKKPAAKKPEPDKEPAKGDDDGKEPAKDGDGGGEPSES